MKPSRRSSVSSALQSRSNSFRTHGRVTQEDIQAACLRRWDGQARVTTDWANLFHEPELCFPHGDLLIYLREPGQSSRGPAFRVHKAKLKERDFDFLLDRCIDRSPIHPGTKCLMSSCHGCDKHSSPSELYMPAPANAELDEIFDHHITTRNFFAWLYDLPLAGRALGRSLVILYERIEYYRPNDPARASSDIVSYAETQRYLDFRECVDHALASLLLAECLRIEDLWVDAFSHCVGMSHRGLNTSLEYWAISYETRLLLHKAQLEMETRLESARKSVCDFFESDLSGNFLGLPQVARNHFDRFRSWLHSYHIDLHGFWPPYGFENAQVEQEIYTSMYSGFRNLYHHLVDPTSSTGMADLQMSASGGLCTVQNIQAFDFRNGYESLPKTMPLLPREPDLDDKKLGLQRRKSWNPLVRRKLDKDKRKALRMQALITASNRDWAIMECPLVRRYSEFESQMIMDDFETINMVDGRKVRWILIYAILQTLISVMQTPKQVRNTEGLTYLLCCQPPKIMPWQSVVIPKRAPTLQKRRSMIEPDAQYNHSNLSSQDTVTKVHSLSKSLKEKRRQSLPARITSMTSRPSTSGSTSIKRLIIPRISAKDDIPPVPKSPGFCEILVQGYGNGLNEIETRSPSQDHFPSDNIGLEDKPQAQISEPVPSDDDATQTRSKSNSTSTDQVPELTPTSSATVSRESSNASSNSTWSKTSSSNDDNDVVTKTPTQEKPHVSVPDLSTLVVSETSAQDLDDKRESRDLNHVFDEEGLLRTVHFNTRTWDEFLGIA